MTNKIVLMVAVLALIVFAAPAHATVKTYQVTGPVLSLTTDKVVVQKGSEKWEIALGSITTPANLKVGSKVTIEYTMSAATITVKDASASAPSGTSTPSPVSPKK